MISRLTRDASGWHRLDLVRGLPRSEENHATNTLVLDPATNTLYVAQGGNTNMGAPSLNFGDLPEYAYSGAILKVDLNAIGDTTYDLPTLADDNHPHARRPVRRRLRPHQAKITPSSPVQVYAPGFRNPFSLVRTRAGQLYAWDNGSNAGWGDVPVGAGPGGTVHQRDRRARDRPERQPAPHHGAGVLRRPPEPDAREHGQHVQHHQSAVAGSGGEPDRVRDAHARDQWFDLQSADADHRHGRVHGHKPR